jgi:MFS family permease
LQISAQLALEVEEKAGQSWTHLLTERTELRRILIAVAALTSLQTNGAQTIQAYQVSSSITFLLENMLIEAVSAVYWAWLLSPTTLLMSGVFQVVLSIGCVGNMVLVDKIGRRPLFMGGFIILSVCLAMFTLCSAKYEQTGQKSIIFYPDVL